MPFMGGMEATELIRTYEQTHVLEPTPIIALTAHASTFPQSMFQLHTVADHDRLAVIGDRERCLQAGMDDHITSKCTHNRESPGYLTVSCLSLQSRCGGAT